MGNPARAITILPLGSIEQEALARIRLALETAFAASVALLPPREIPVGAWMPSRRQHDSCRLIMALEEEGIAVAGKLLAICDSDLCTPVLTYVFGVAQVGGRCALISLQRLRPEVYGLPPDRLLFLQRCAKEAIHEIGHTFGLTHCHRFNCVMYPSPSVERTDLKPETLCPACAATLQGLEGTDTRR